MALRPAPLRAGDLVAVVAPAGPPPAAQLAAGVAVLRSWGLRVRVDVPDPAAGTLPHLAGTDAQRAGALQRALTDPEVAAVLCARGGYGSLRTLELLDVAAVVAACVAYGPKTFAGSSDITALHAVLGPRCDVVTLFGPMVATAAGTTDVAALAHLRAALFDPPSVLPVAPGATVLVAGRASGPLTGGNLSLLVSGLGVPGVPSPPDGAIAVLEDVTEAPYRIDHFLTHLRRGGWFDRVSAVVCGSWQECGPPEQVRAVLVDRLGDLGVPVVDDVGFGHCAGQLTLPLGAVAELDATGARSVLRLG